MSFLNAIISNDIFYVFGHFCDFFVAISCPVCHVCDNFKLYKTFFFFKRKLIIYYLFVLFYLNKIVTHQVFCCIYNLSHVSKLIDTCMVLKQTNRRICLAYFFPKIFKFTQLFEICHLWYSRAVVNSLVYSSSRTRTRIKYLKEIHV